MKKIYLIIAITIMLISCIGCEVTTINVEEETTTKTTTITTTTTQKVEENYYIILNNNKLSLNDEFDDSLYGAYQDVIEDKNSPYGDKDRTYYFYNVEVITYESNGKEYAYEFYSDDDSFETEEGLKVSGTKEEMEKIYGNNYQELNGTYTYTKGKSLLIITIENDVITSIKYSCEVE